MFVICLLFTSPQPQQRLLLAGFSSVGCYGLFFVYLFIYFYHIKMFNFVVSFKLKINLDVMDKRKQKMEYSFQIMDIFFKEILELFSLTKIIWII